MSIGEGEFTQYPFFVLFCQFFLLFFFSMKMYALFRPYFYKFIFALVDNYILIKILCRSDESDFSKYGCNSLPKLFSEPFVQYVTIWLVRIWTYKNVVEKEHTFSCRRKNVQKRTKANEKRTLCKSNLGFCFRKMMNFLINIFFVGSVAERVKAFIFCFF